MDAVLSPPVYVKTDLFRGPNEPDHPRNTMLSTQRQGKLLCNKKKMKLKQGKKYGQEGLQDTANRTMWTVR
jgi:hypothetical protein